MPLSLANPRMPYIQKSGHTRQRPHFVTSQPGFKYHLRAVIISGSLNSKIGLQTQITMHVVKVVGDELCEAGGRDPCVGPSS